jgi:hypothetical protein
MFTKPIPRAVARIRRSGLLARRRWPAVLLTASALLLATAGSAAAAPTPIPPNAANWSGSAGFGSSAPGFYIDSFGLVHLEGAAKQISLKPPLARVLGTLPPAARPVRDVYTIAHSFNGTYADVEIETNGTIFLYGAAAPAVEDLSFVSLEGITYQPASTLLPSVIPLNAPDWSPTTGFGAVKPAWYTDGSGLVHLEGAARQSAKFPPNPNLLGTLPPVARPDRNVYTIVHTTDGTYANVAILRDGTINLIDPHPPLLKDYSLIVSLEGISYQRLSFTTGMFTNFANWSENAGFGSEAPGWYEDSAGIIHLQGAVKQTVCCTASANLVATLPVVARPTRNVYTIVHTFNGTYADLAILTNGQIWAVGARPPAVSDLSFLSLEGITFDAASPKFFELAVRGTEKQGATVAATLRKPRALALLVRAARGDRLAKVGVVVLGRYQAGVSRIHWNLEVNGQLLAPGSYEVSLHALNRDLLSVPAAPGARTLLVLANGHVRTGK